MCASRLSPSNRKVMNLLIWLIAGALLWLAVRSVPVTEVIHTLARLTGGQLLVLTLVNILAVLSLSSRWWWILRSLNETLRFTTLSLYRLSSFAISYFTPGPQFGGEPLQVVLLQRRHSVSGSMAAASVSLDKAIEVMGNTTFLVFGILVALRLQFLPGDAGLPVLYIALGLLCVPLIFLVAAWNGHTPLSKLLLLLPNRLRQAFPGFARFQSGLKQTEEQISLFCCDRPQGLIGAMSFSFLTWVVLIGENWLMQKYLGFELDLWETIAVLTAARLAFLTPLPGGIGALEVSQTLALTALGYSSAEGLSLGLLIRGRDLAFGGVGLIIGALYTRPARPPAASP